jgi:hypothetical protein
LGFTAPVPHVPPLLQIMFCGGTDISLNVTLEGLNVCVVPPVFTGGAGTFGSVGTVGPLLPPPHPDSTKSKAMPMALSRDRFMNNSLHRE